MTPCDEKGAESHYAAVLDLHEAKPVRPSRLWVSLLNIFLKDTVQNLLQSHGNKSSSRKWYFIKIFITMAA